MKKTLRRMMLFLVGCLSTTLAATAADVLPEAGKTYYIKSDNVNTSKVDEDYYLYNNNGSLGLSVTATRGGAAYLWTCEKNGDSYRFKNQTGKYLYFTSASGDRASLPLSDDPFDFTINPANKVNEGCLPLYALGKFVLVKNGGTHFNQAGSKYDKATSGYSSDYIFEEYNEGDRVLTITTDPSDVLATFSWNGENHTGSGSFLLKEGTTVTAPALTAQIDPSSPYRLEGFYENGQNLGTTVQISSMTADRNLTAKFDLDIYSTTYGEKWVRINWPRNASYMMGLPAAENYDGVAPKTIINDMGSEAQLWCLVGTKDGFKLYNKAAGDGLALTTAGNNYGNGTVTTMEPASGAISWHLVQTANGLNISPVGNNNFGLNSYGGAAQDLKLYGNNDGGNIWSFQRSGANALAFQVELSGTPKALNTQMGQLQMSLGAVINNTISLTYPMTGASQYYLADGTSISLTRAGNQYRGYIFKGFRVNGGTLQPEIENLAFTGSVKTITAVYEVDTEDPSQYLFYSPGIDGHPYRIPAITTTKEGNILAISDFRWCNNDIGFGHVDIVGRISKDNGATWGEQFDIAVGTGVSGAHDCGYGDAAVVTDSETGRILIMCCTGNVFYSNGTRENPLRAARLYSEDGGKTWSKPEDITEQMYDLLPTSTGQFIGAGKICQSRVTKVGEYYRLYAAMCTRIGNYVIYSDDFGQTWAILGPNNVSCAPDGNEPKCEELPDGSVVLSSRKYSGRYFNIYKYSNVETAEGEWLGVVSSNDVEGGLSFNWNSTNGEIQLAKVIKKSDNSFHYMMIQSIPYGRINEGDEERSNVAIYYKVFESETMNSTLEIATGWTQGMVLQNAKGGYSTMCIQPDKKLAFFYEEGPVNYCMVYRPISIEELTGEEYTMYDPAIHGDESQLEAVANLKAACNEAQTYTIGTGAGTFTDPDGAFTAALTAAQNALEGGLEHVTADELNTLTDNLRQAMTALTLNMPEAGKFYRIKSKTSGKYISADVNLEEKPNMTEDGTLPSTVFFLSADGRLTTSGCLNLHETTKLKADMGSTFNITASPFTGYYIIQVKENTSGAFYDYSATNGKVDTWRTTSDEKCAWILEEVTDAAQQPKLTKTLTADYATLAAPVALNIPAGVKAYTATVDEATESAILEEVAGVIPAGTAVVLKKENGADTDLEFTFAAEGNAENANNLVGVYTQTTVSTDINAYVLGNGAQGIGFYQMNGTDRTMDANKAYLALPASMNAIRSITIGGPTTGIEETITDAAQEEYYDLQGRRVMNPTKGIYVTKSGKKVVFGK